MGATPSLLDLDSKDGDLRRSLDFRQVYAAVLEDWLGLPAKEALGGTFEGLPLFRSGAAGRAGSPASASPRGTSTGPAPR